MSPSRGELFTFALEENRSENGEQIELKQERMWPLTVRRNKRERGGHSPLRTNSSRWGVSMPKGHERHHNRRPPLGWDHTSAYRQPGGRGVTFHFQKKTSQPLFPGQSATSYSHPEGGGGLAKFSGQSLFFNHIWPLFNVNPEKISGVSSYGPHGVARGKKPPQSLSKNQSVTPPGGPGEG